MPPLYCTSCQKICKFINSDEIESSKDEIDNFIYGLTYSRDQVLVHKGGRKYSVPLMKECQVDDEKNFIVITRERRTAENGTSDIGGVTTNEHRTFPGALLLANERLVDNMPDVLAVDRAPLTYTINLPGLKEKSSFTIKPSFGEYFKSKEKVLETWFDEYQNNDNIIANLQSELSFAYSKELLRTNFGLGLAETKIEHSIDFSSMANNERLIVIYKFKQVFYTVSVEPTKKPSDLFASGITVEELQRKTNSDNPPVMVDSVSYGRVIYVKVETSSTGTEATTILSNKVPLFSISAGCENGIENKLQNLDIQIFVMGGSVGHINIIKAQSFKEVTNIIVRYSKFSRSNLGYPISSSAQFVKDNSKAVVLMSTDYYETTRTVHSKGIVKIVHKGWFVMKWYIFWKEVNYDENGTKRVKDVCWDGNGSCRTAPFERELELPGNTVDIHVVAKENTGLTWEGFRTVIDRSGIPLIGNRTFSVWGTTLHPKYEITPPL